MEHFDKVKEYLTELGLSYDVIDEQEEMVSVTQESMGINQLIIDCEYPIVIFEQFLFEIKNPSQEKYGKLLQINREMVHGALTLDESGSKCIFRDTLRLENLDLNEVAGTIEALGLAMAEHANTFIEMAKN